MYRLILALLAATFMTVSCNITKPTAVFTIASMDVNCEGIGSQKCLLIKKEGQTDWQFFHGNIEGFNYEVGNEYVLKVREEIVHNSPADASSIRYTLLKEISKTKKTSDNLPETKF